MVKIENGILEIVCNARTNGEIGRVLECMLEVGIYGKIQFLETVTAQDTKRIVKIEIPEEKLSQEKAIHLLRYIRRSADVSL